MLLTAVLLLTCLAPLAMADEEKPTLRMLAFNAAFDPNTDVNAQEIEKVTGYHV